MTKLKKLVFLLTVVCALLLVAIVPAAAQDSQTLTIMFWGDPTAPAFWQGIVDKFVAAGHPGLTVNFIHQPDEYETKLQALIAAGQGPDVFLLNSNQILRFADEGVILDQQPLYEAAGVDPDAAYVDAAIWRYNDRLLAVAPSLHSIIVFYNKAMFDAAGLEYPPTTADTAWTWDQFVETAQKLTSGEGMDKTYGVYAAPWSTVWTPFLFSNGASWFNDDVSELTLNSPEAVEVLQNMANLRLEAGVAPTLDIADSIGWDVMLQSGKAAMLVDGTWNMPTMIDMWGADLGIAVLPKYKEYRTATFSDPPVIWNDSPNKQLAFDFIRFMTDPALQIDTYRSGNGVPTERDYLTGDKLAEWLAGTNLPEHYDTVVVDNLNYSGTMPGKVTALMPAIEWPVVMDKLMPAFRGELPMQEAMDAAHDNATAVLAGQ